MASQSEKKNKIRSGIDVKKLNKAYKKTEDERRKLKNEVEELKKKLSLAEKDAKEKERNSKIIESNYLKVLSDHKQAMQRVKELEEELRELEKELIELKRFRETTKKAVKFDKHDKRRKLQCDFNCNLEVDAGEQQEFSLKCGKINRLEGSSQHHCKSTDPEYLYGEIRPGTITHEDVQRQLVVYFAKYRRRYGSKVIDSANLGAQTLPCLTIQLAYNTSKDLILQAVKETLQESDLPQVKLAKNLLLKCRASMDTSEGSSFHTIIQEIHALFSEPTKTEYSKTHWEEHKMAFSTLLNCSNFDKGKACRDLKEHILTFENQQPPAEMCEDAVKIAFHMVTLIPPGVLCQPKYYVDGWQEKRLKFWEESSLESSLIYFRPIFFFSALGHVGCTGEVGNVIPKQ